MIPLFSLAFYVQTRPPLADSSISQWGWPMLSHGLRRSAYLPTYCRAEFMSPLPTWLQAKDSRLFETKFWSYFEVVPPVRFITTSCIPFKVCSYTSSWTAWILVILFLNICVPLIKQFPAPPLLVQKCCRSLTGCFCQLSLPTSTPGLQPTVHNRGCHLHLFCQAHATLQASWHPASPSTSTSASSALAYSTINLSPSPSFHRSLLVSAFQFLSSDLSFLLVWWFPQSQLSSTSKFVSSTRFRPTRFS